MSAEQALLTRALDWVAHDPDPSTRAVLSRLITAVEAGDAAALADLGSRFTGPLTFGTAGLRGEVGAGESRMNVAVVMRTTVGLARYLLGVVGEAPRVVVGCDARHGSSVFVDAVLEVLCAAGITALRLPPRLPTPVLAYAVRALDADAGVMITASHNPPADNGYKVYLGGRATDEHGRGVQIIDPADREIAAHIDAAPPADEIARSSTGIVDVSDEVVDAYVARCASLRGRGPASSLRVVLTPLHGVGGSTISRVLARAGIDDVHVVESQAEPDPDFPTVSFPNPEEPGALDLAVAKAREVAADLIIALDPDADRCSVAIPLDDGGWRRLTGDEVGALLGEQAAARDDLPGSVFACSVVSSRLLAKIASAHGLSAATTLTGFKWIARTPNLRFGFEEALGYCTDPTSVRDKDGISAAVNVISLAESLAAQGQTLQDALDGQARRFGLHATDQRSVRVDEIDQIGAAMARLRAAGPQTLAGSPVISSVDLINGALGLPPTDAVILQTADDDRVVVRPSGTEPKLKCYLEVVLSCAEEVPHEVARARLTSLADDIGVVLGI